jgi:hypothetical protein
MRLFTVHVPVSAASGHPVYERAQFIHDGFHKWAFVFGALWCLWRGLWIAAAAVIIVSAALFGAGRALGLPLEAQFLLQFVFALLLGLEAPNLRRFSLGRRRFLDAGAVAAADEDEAERLFFGRGAEHATDAPSRLPFATPAPSNRSGFADDIVGLFPEHRGR